MEDRKFDEGLTPDDMERLLDKYEKRAQALIAKNADDIKLELEVKQVLKEHQAKYPKLLAQHEGKPFLLGMNAKYDSGSYYFLNSFAEFEDAYKAGKTLREIHETMVHSDCGAENYAFICLVEEVTGKKITNAKELIAAANLDKEYLNDIEESFLMACESKFVMKVRKVLNDGGSYSDIEALDAASCYLNEEQKAEQIGWSIVLHYHLDDLVRPSITDVAAEIGAPYEVMLDIRNNFRL